ncbi:hypothetical protein LTR04_001475 [Oleoguttula sp. CCFEE 6159]|nr:hypothetical protein LTR04_001475 [Oleoguttula sp. CCFEE 6159]
MIQEGAEFVGESGKKYLAVSSLGQSNVWTAVDADTPTDIYVIKEPGVADDRTGWPEFQQEMIMHELFKGCPSIRQQVDRILPASKADPPRIVLEIFENTVWTARAKRPFTAAELKSVTRSTLVGLRDIHAKGLVYADLKMENILINGFNVTSEDSSSLVTKLGDLGLVMYPAKGKVQPVSYRAPEVYFKDQITQAADIWSWALIFCHLLEAQTSFGDTGIYDDLYRGTMKAREQAVRYAITNDYDLRNVEYYKDCVLPMRDAEHVTGNHWDQLRKGGVSEHDIEFLQWVLNPDPTQRPTAQAILDRDWLRNIGKTNSSSEKSQRPQAQTRPSTSWSPYVSEAPTPSLQEGESTTYLDYGKELAQKAVSTFESYIYQGKEAVFGADTTASDANASTSETAQGPTNGTLLPHAKSEQYSEDTPVTAHSKIASTNGALPQKTESQQYTNGAAQTDPSDDAHVAPGSNTTHRLENSAEAETGDARRPVLATYLSYERMNGASRPD